MTYQKKSLTRRQEQLLIHIANDGTTQTFAENHKLSFWTVNAHRRELMQTIGATCIQQVVKYAILHRYIKLDSLC